MPSKPQPLSVGTVKLESLTVIAKDQQRYLDKPNSWHAELKSIPNGLVRVPEHVIESVKSAYVAAKNVSPELPITSTNDRSGSPAEISEDHEASSPLSGRVENSPPPRSLRPPLSSRRSSIQRTSSPSDKASEMACRLQSSIVSETPDTRSRLAPPSQLPPPPRRSIKYDYPSSAAEEELEIEVPEAAGAAQENSSSGRVAMTLSSTAASQVDRENSKMDTPPCAQPSRSLLSESPRKHGSPQISPACIEQRRTKRMKPIQFTESDTISVVSKPPTTATAFQRMASTKLCAQVESSLSTEAESIVPDTTYEPARPVPSTLSPPPPSVPQQVQDQQAEEDDISDIEMEDAQANGRRSPSMGQGGPAPSQEASVPGHLKTVPGHPSTLLVEEKAHITAATGSTSVEVEVDVDVQRSPFDEFVSKYPSYTQGENGTLWSFVRGCVCLDIMRKSSSLRDFLWDDFIRAFTHGYMDYIGSVARPQPALQWFSKLEGPPDFNKMVVHSRNLDGILQWYTDDVAKARNSIATKGGRSEPTAKKHTARAQPIPPARQVTISQPAPSKKTGSPTTTEALISPATRPGLVRPHCVAGNSRGSPAKTPETPAVLDTSAFPTTQSRQVHSDPLAKSHRTTPLKSLQPARANSPASPSSPARSIQDELAAVPKEPASAAKTRGPIMEDVPSAQNTPDRQMRPERETTSSKPSPKRILQSSIEEYVPDSPAVSHPLSMKEQSLISETLSPARPARTTTPTSSITSAHGASYYKRLISGRRRHDSKREEQLRKVIERRNKRGLRNMSDGSVTSSASNIAT